MACSRTRLPTRRAHRKHVGGIVITTAPTRSKPLHGPTSHFPVPLITPTDQDRDGAGHEQEPSGEEPSTVFDRSSEWTKDDAPAGLAKFEVPRETMINLINHEGSQASEPDAAPAAGPSTSTPHPTNWDLMTRNWKCNWDPRNESKK